MLQHRVRGVGEERRDMVLNDGVDKVVVMVVIGSSMRSAASNNMINQKSQNTVAYSFRCRCWRDHSFRSATVERRDKGRGNKGPETAINIGDDDSTITVTIIISSIIIKRKAVMS